MIRSGILKSRIAAPSRKNSGLEATLVPSGAPSSAKIRAISSPVPTGTVDLVTTTTGPVSARASSRTAA